MAGALRSQHLVPELLCPAHTQTTPSAGPLGYYRFSMSSNKTDHKQVPGDQATTDSSSSSAIKNDQRGATDQLRESTSWSISTPRIFDILSPAKTVLIAGCGGGYDVLSGLPLYFALRRQGKNVLLANLSFTSLDMKAGKDRYCEMCVRVTHNMRVKSEERDGGYFPEYYLSQWFWEKFREDVSVYAFWREIGVSQLSAAYKKICSENKVDAIVLVDGGTDSLMFGFEERMGTPVEDQTSIMAASSVSSVATKLLVCIGFGVDSFHGVSHGLFLENVATLERNGGYLGCFSVSRHSLEGQLYHEGYQAVAKRMQPSIVSASITDAMLGYFGNHHSTSRTGSSKLFINPLMTIYWSFELAKLVAEIPYAGELLETKSAAEVMKVIVRHHSKVEKDGKIRKPIPLPM